MHADEAFANRSSIAIGDMLPITASVNKQAKKDLELRKKRLDSLVRTIVLCGRQGFALRGHRNESVPLPNPSEYKSGIIQSDVNRGNFLQLLEFRRQAGDDNININKKSQYTSPDIQNQLILATASHITSQVVAEVNSTPYFSIISDETRDISNVEQLCLAIRYYCATTRSTQEKFLCFIPLVSIRGETIAKAILEKLKDLNIPIANCVGQAYDGASNMSGPNSGVAAIIQKENKRARYAHCKSHQLNLALMKPCKNVQPISDMMNTQAVLCTFFADSPKRQAKLTDTIKMAPGTTAKMKLCSLSKTRWVERYTALETTVELLPFIGGTLQAMLSDREYRQDWDNISSMMRALMNFEFIYSLVVCCNIMASSNGLCVKLQGRSIDLAGAGTLIRNTQKKLMNFRESVDEYSHLWYTQAENLAIQLNVTPSIPRTCGRQLHRSNMPASSPEVYYLRSVTIKFLDHLLSEYRARFEENAQLYPLLNLLPLAATASSWRHQDDTWVQTVYNAAQVYVDLLPSSISLKTELKSWKHHCNMLVAEGVTLSDKASVAIKYAEEMGFSNTVVLLKILGVLPVTSCEAERCFSRLAYLKDDLRSTMGHDRMSALATMMLHRDKDIDINSVINPFLSARGYV